MADAKPLDIERGTAACGGDRALHLQVVGMLAGDLAERIAALRRALLAGDLTTVGRMAHKHKGACLAVGALALAERFASIDLAARAGDTHRTGQMADLLATEADAFLQAVAALQPRTS